MMDISFRFLSYWRVGTGREHGGSLDAVCARDHDGLPYIPGKQVRGLMREAVTQAEELEWFCNAKGAARDLFGSTQSDMPEDEADTISGCLRFDSAVMHGNDRLALNQNASLKPRLFTEMRSTAVDPVTGTAKPRALRLQEVALPVELRAQVIPLAGVRGDWQDILQEAAPLILAAGSGRKRGLGRVIVSCQSRGA